MCRVVGKVVWDVWYVFELCRRDVGAVMGLAECLCGCSAGLVLLVCHRPCTALHSTPSPSHNPTTTRSRTSRCLCTALCCAVPQVEDMLKRSFAEFRSQRAQPELLEALEKGQAALARLRSRPWPVSPLGTSRCPPPCAALIFAKGAYLARGRRGGLRSLRVQQRR
jgi:hypothetical protein